MSFSTTQSNQKNQPTRPNIVLHCRSAAEIDQMDYLLCVYRVAWMDTKHVMEPIVSLLPTTASPHTFFFRRSSSSSQLGVSFIIFNRRHNNNNNNNNSLKKAIEIRVPAARDRVIDFGKHTGKMLGTVPSEYLRWMSKNLTTGEWGELAEDVLEDEVYADRMEWEAAESLLNWNREALVGSGSCVARELEEMNNKFGWDYDDLVRWSKVDFGLLGTSKGGRLPRRVQVEQGTEESRNLKKPRCSSGGDESRKRRERAAKKREQHIQIGGLKSNEEEEDDDKERQQQDKGSRSRFPGRENLINKLGI